MTKQFTITIKPTEKQKIAWKYLKDNKTQFIIFGNAAGTGKVVAKGDSILTPFGFKKIEDCKEGDRINNPDGSISKILKLHDWHNYDKWIIHFQDKTSLITTGGHLWNAWRCNKGRSIKNKRKFGEDSAEVIETKGILDWIKRGYNTAIPVNYEQVFHVTSRKRVDINPYILGVLLGDGGLTKHLTLTTADEEIINNIKPLIQDCFIRQTGKYQYSIVQDKRNKQGFPINELANKFKKLGLMGLKTIDKFIPRQFKYSSVEDRYSIIQGLLDTDGYISKDGTVYFTTISKQLANDASFILRSLGAVVSTNKKKAGYKKDGNYIKCNDAYELYIKHRHPSKLFRLERKKKRCKENKKICKRIKSIEITKEKFSGRCITVSHPNGLYITNDFIVTHNSWCGCEWLLMSAIAYPGTKWFLARNELKRIMASTYITFLKVCKWHNISNSAWKLNSQYNYIELWNGSRIDLLDVSYKPSDPLYERFGSTEYTSGWLEEAGEIRERVFEVLKSRIGRHLNDKYNLLPKILITCNPKKNWLYFNFYKPWTENTLPEDSAFIKALYTDNPFTVDIYGKILNKIKDPVLRARLRDGIWEYEDDDSALMDYDKIIKIFTNEYKPGMDDRLYLTVDPARFGRDKCVFMLWQGWHIRKIWYYDKSSTAFIEEKIESILKQYMMPRNSVAVDSDGIGGSAPDHLPGVYAFVNAASPVEEFDDNKKFREQLSQKFTYKNLRAQCYDRLASYVNEEIITCYKEIDPQVRSWLIQELEAIKRKDVDNNESKFQIISKDEIKEIIGRSPDFSDSAMQRCVFDLGKPRKTMAEDYGEVGVVW